MDGALDVLTKLCPLFICDHQAVEILRKKADKFPMQRLNPRDVCGTDCQEFEKPGVQKRRLIVEDRVTISAQERGKMLRVCQESIQDSVGKLQLAPCLDNHVEARVPIGHQSERPPFMVHGCIVVRRSGVVWQLRLISPPQEIGPRQIPREGEYPLNLLWELVIHCHTQPFING